MSRDHRNLDALLETLGVLLPQQVVQDRRASCSYRSPAPNRVPCRWCGIEGVRLPHLQLIDGVGRHVIGADQPRLAVVPRVGLSVVHRSAASAGETNSVKSCATNAIANEALRIMVDPRRDLILRLAHRAVFRYSGLLANSSQILAPVSLIPMGGQKSTLERHGCPRPPPLHVDHRCYYAILRGNHASRFSLCRAVESASPILLRDDPALSRTLIGLSNGWCAH